MVKGMHLPLTSFAIVIAAVIAPSSLNLIDEAAKRHEFKWFGLTVEKAREKATENDLFFRVIKEDGRYLQATKDHRPGRINAHVWSDRIVAIEIEAKSGSIVEGVIDLNHLSFLGLREEEAIAQADLDGLPFRVVIRNGISHPVTLDYIEMRANAVVEKGVVVALTTG